MAKWINLGFCRLEYFSVTTHKAPLVVQTGKRMRNVDSPKKEEAHQPETWTGYVDWRNRPALRGKHGGMVAASFVLVVEVLENMAFLANASNLVTYLTEFMHLSPSHSATAVTNFMGTAFLLAVLGGFLSDAFFTTYHIYLISALLEFLGLVILTVQAKTPALKPAACNTPTRCVAISGGKATLLFVGLYLTALGVGGIKGSLPAHGAEQFDADTAQGRKARSTFFNYFVFCLSCGGLVAVTLVVWIEDNLGWQWGFSISTIAILLSLLVFLAGSATYRTRYPPEAHSQVTTIGKVLVAAVFNSCCTQKPKNAVVDMVPSPVMIDDLKAQRPENTAKEEKDLISAAPPNAELKFLNKATQGKSALSAVTCTAEEVEDVKIVFKLLPIFLSTIMLSCCLAQLSTFSVHQAATMDTRIGSLIVPPASLPLFPILFILFLAPIYDHAILPLARRLTKNEAGITNLQRIGFGLLMSAVAMAAAAAVETKRKRTASRDLPTGGASAPLPISFLWLVFQYLFLGSADLFTLAGMLEFFFEEAPGAMRSLATALSWASLAMGYYLSSVLVAVVNRVTGRGGRPAWLEGRSLDAYYLERFYWLMCALSAINFLHYLFWASRYRYRSRNF